MFKFWITKNERDALHKVEQLEKEKADLSLKVLDLETVVAKKDEVIDVLNLRLREIPKQYFPNPSTEDPSPLDAQERVAYLSQVVTFFENIGLKKLSQLTAKAKEDLSNPMNQREYDLAIKGTINAFAQLMDWYDDCDGELRSTVQDKANQNTN